MRAVVITRTGPPEVLAVQERPEPVPGAGELLVDVRAAGVNFADLLARMGLYPDAPSLPAVVGYEVAGTVAALGPGVAGPAVGTRVLAGTRFGGYAERVTTAAANALPIPNGLGFEQAAAIPVNYATAWEALVGAAGVQPGEKVLVHAAAGGVGIAATQIAKRQGAEVFGTASTGKQARLGELGVDHPVDYTRRRWERGVPPLDVVLDPLGGGSFRRSYRMLAPGGRLVAYGASNVTSGEQRNLPKALSTMARMPRFNVLKQMSESKAVIGLNILTLWDARGSLARWLEPLGALLEDGTVRPVVAETFPFDRAADAHRFIGERRNVGKVLLAP